MKCKIGETYTGTPVGFVRGVTGTILSVYENTVMLEVQEYDNRDRAQIIERHNRVIVKKTSLTPKQSAVA